MKTITQKVLTSYGELNVDFSKDIRDRYTVGTFVSTGESKGVGFYLKDWNPININKARDMIEEYMDMRVSG